MIGGLFGGGEKSPSQPPPSPQWETLYSTTIYRDNNNEICKPKFQVRGGELTVKNLVADVDLMKSSLYNDFIKPWSKSEDWVILHGSNGDYAGMFRFDNNSFYAGPTATPQPVDELNMGELESLCLLLLNNPQSETPTGKMARNYGELLKVQILESRELVEDKITNLMRTK